MTDFTENTVFMILFNYSDNDYSIIKIMSSLDNAYKYIVNEETHEHFTTNVSSKLVEINQKDDIKFPYLENNLNILYVKTGKYTNLNIYEKSDISQYIIVPMKID